MKSNIEFPLQLDPPGKDLLDGANYDSLSNVGPDGVQSNFLTKS